MLSSMAAAAFVAAVTDFAACWPAMQPAAVTAIKTNPAALICFMLSFYGSRAGARECEMLESDKFRFGWPILRRILPISRIPGPSRAPSAASCHVA